MSLPEEQLQPDSPPIYRTVEFPTSFTEEILNSMLGFFTSEELDFVLFPSREFDIRKLATMQMLGADEEATLIRENLGTLSEEELELLEYSTSFEEVPYDQQRKYPE